MYIDEDMPRISPEAERIAAIPKEKGISSYEFARFMYEIIVPEHSYVRNLDQREQYSIVAKRLLQDIAANRHLWRLFLHYVDAADYEVNDNE